jgi:thiosulfate/3-mercaptopyruvate sulfurtransferase
MTRYVIIGAGAVGATIAAELHTAGREVVLTARGRNLEALRDNGLRYARPDGELRVDVPVAAGPAEVELRSDDVLLLATKSQDTEEVLRAWAWQPVKTTTGALRSAASELPVVVLQNELDNERAALRRFASVIGAVVWLPASHVTPGEVVSPGAPSTGAFWLGAYPRGDHDRLAEIAADLTAAKFLTTVVPDIQRWKAGKLLGNLANALDALYRPSELRTVAARAARAEATVVLRAAGLPFTDLDRARLPGLAEAVVIHQVPGHERGGSSTWQSLARAASPETDYLNGEVVLQARLLGRTAPYNAALAERVQRAFAEGTAPGTFDDADLTATLPGLRRRAVLADVDELHGLVERGDAPVLLDVRWALGDPDGHEHYREGHLPGAVYVDLDTDLASPATPEDGRHPLPDLAELQTAARRWGISAGRPVVTYDDNGGLSAARAWWLLRWAGLTDVRLLDGSLGSWRTKGYALSTGDEQAPPGDVELDGGHLPTLTADEAAALASEHGVLLDARAGERYRGETEPVDPRAGHIPGARSAPTGDNLTTSGTFRSTAELGERFAHLGAAGDAEVGVYCGSGVTAAHQVAALAVTGVTAALYPGSWSAWSADPDRPAAAGADSFPSGKKNEESR